jgi:protein TonB
MNLVLEAREAEFPDEAVAYREPGKPAAMAAAASGGQPSIYGAKPVNWTAIAIVIVVHAAMLAALLSLNVISIKRDAPKAIVVKLIPMPPEPPMQELPVQPQKVKPQPSPIVVPPPIMRMVNVAPSPVITTPDPPPVRAVVVAPAPPAPTGPVSASDLSSTMVSAKPPRYPIESRRKHEQGTVVLTVLVGMDGTVANVSIAKSSGFPRLDSAALEAVARWRWSPTTRNGQPVMVKGLVDIPFVLTG